MSKQIRVQIIAIDPQIDFTEPGAPLYVPNGEKNAVRSGALITRLVDVIEDIHISLDSHILMDISHPLYWIDPRTGKHPDPYTIITLAEVEAGKWTTTVISDLVIAKKYLAELEKLGHYPHRIWPEHCIIGTPGHNINTSVMAGVHAWERKRRAVANYITKGTNRHTEHFSILQAEVIDPNDPGTRLNTAMVNAVSQADVVGWVGEALSHCYKFSFKNMLSAFNYDPDLIKRQWILTDTTSAVGGFEKDGEDFLNEMISLGVNVTTSDKFLK